MSIFSCVISNLSVVQYYILEPIGIVSKQPHDIGAIWHLLSLKCQ